MKGKTLHLLTSPSAIHRLEACLNDSPVFTYRMAVFPNGVFNIGYRTNQAAEAKTSNKTNQNNFRSFDFFFLPLTGAFFCVLIYSFNL
jgi:hypothetical protein